MKPQLPYLVLLALALLLCARHAPGLDDLDTDELVAGRVEALETLPPEEGGDGKIHAHADMELADGLDVDGDAVFLEGADLAPLGDVPMGPFTRRPGDPPRPGAPAWWAARGVTAPNAAPDDFAPATQGQLKWIADRAAAELARSWVGAGPAVTNLVAAFTLAGNNDLLTLGQLKNTAKPFWDRIIAAGQATAYPWANGAPDDLAAATVGQVKTCFAFDPSQWMPEELSILDFAVLMDDVYWGDWHYNNPTWVVSPYDSSARVKAVGATRYDRTALFSDGTAVQWRLQNGVGEMAVFTGVEAMCTGKYQTLLVDKNGGCLGIVNPGMGNYVYYEAHFGSLPVQMACDKFHAIGRFEDGSVTNIGAFAGNTGSVNMLLSAPPNSLSLSEIVPDSWTGWSLASFPYPATTQNPPYQTIDVAASPDATFALRSDRTLKMWGSPLYGLADVPPDLSNVSKMAGSDYYYSVALLTDGSVRVWGLDTYAPDLSNAIDIACTDYQAVALLDDHPPSAVIWYWAGISSYAPVWDDIVAPLIPGYHSVWGITVNGHIANLITGSMLVTPPPWKVKGAGSCTAGLYNMDEAVIVHVGIKPDYFNGWWGDWFGGSDLDVAETLRTDSNGDGFNNLIKLQTDRNPLFAISSAISSDGRESFSWTPVAGATDYTVTVLYTDGITVLLTTNVTGTSLSLAEGFASNYNCTVSVTANGTGNDARYTASTSIDCPSKSGVTAIKLADPFSASLPFGIPNVYSQKFTINRTGGWQQYYISTTLDGYGSSPHYKGMRLDWSDDKGGIGTIISANYPEQRNSIRLPLSDNATTLTLTLVAEAAYVETYYPLYLLIWSPPVAFEGIGEPFDLLDGSGKALVVQTQSDTADIGFTIDISGRPADPTTVTPEEIAGIAGFFAGTTSDLTHDPVSGLPTGGTVTLGTGKYDLDALGFVPPPAPALPLPGGPPEPPPAPPLPGEDPSKLYVIRPSVYVEGPMGFGLGEWPLSDCAGRAYWDYTCPPGTTTVSVSLSTNKSDTFSEAFDILIDGESRTSYEVTADSEVRSIPVQVTTNATHIWSTNVSAYAYYGYRYEREPDESECGCNSECEGGDCSALEGPSGGSIRFRIPLGSPASGKVAGFLSFELHEPAYITRDLFLLTARSGDVTPDSSLDGDTYTCTANCGRILGVTNIITGGVEIHVTSADSNFERHRWVITNDNGGIRFEKINRYELHMSDETFSILQNGGWQRIDHLSGTVETLERDGDEETRTLCEAGPNNTLGATLSRITTVYTNLPATTDGPHRRAVERREWDGPDRTLTNSFTWRSAPGVPFLHGAPRSRWGDTTPWEYHAYDADGRETLRAVQHDGSGAPAFLRDPENCPANLSALVTALGSASATVTEYDYPAPQTPGLLLSDARSPRETLTYVVQDGAEVPVSCETHVYSHGTNPSDDHPTLTVTTTRGAPSGGESIITTSVSYAPDSDLVPEPLRGLPISEHHADGTVQAWAYEFGTYNPNSREFTVQPLSAFQIPNSSFLTPNCCIRSATATTLNPNLIPNLSSLIPNYEFLIPDSILIDVEVTDAAFGRTLLSATYLADPNSELLTPNSERLLSWESRTYDPKGRVRFTERSDGATSTNAYSCCRLLWSEGFDGARTYRSAPTGRDHLYHAMEEASLANLPGADGHRVTRTLSDALGRVTNTTVFASANAPQAYTNEHEAVTGPALTTATEYPDGVSSFRVTTSPGGLLTTTTVHRAQGYALTVTQSPGVLTTNINWRNGNSLIRRVWDGGSTCDLRKTAWENGLRTDLQIHKASDITGPVTNSITRYDALGRVASVTQPRTPNSELVTSYTYAAGTTLLIASETHDPTKNYKLKTINYLYSPTGAQIGTATLDASHAPPTTALCSLTTDTYEQDANGHWWQTTLSIMEGECPHEPRLTLTNALTRTRLAGLGAAAHGVPAVPPGALLISQHEAYTDKDALLQTVSTFFDPVTHANTTVTSSPAAPGLLTVQTTLYGHPLETSTLTIQPDPQIPNSSLLIPNSVIGHAYDGLARQTSAATSTNNFPVTATHYAYDPLGNVASVTEEGGAGIPARITSMLYDLHGHVTNRTDALGNETFHAYDAVGNLTYSYGATYPVSYEYDTAGRMVSMTTLPPGLFSGDDETWRSCFGGWFLFLDSTTRWHYDPATGLLLSKTDAHNQSVTYAYDGFGRMVERVSARGIVTSYAYDPMGNLASKTYSDATPDVTYEYDPFGRMTSATTLDSNHYPLTTNHYTYDGINLAAETQNGQVIQRTYDDYGRPAETTLHSPPSTLHTSYAYDTHGRLATVQGGAGIPACRTDYTYDPLGRLITRQTGSLTADYTRDAFGNVTALTNAWNASLVSAFDYSYDALSRRTARTDHSPLTTDHCTFTYNARSELTNAVLAGCPYEYWYDPVGNNWLSTEGGDTGQGQTFNALNQPDWQFDFTYADGDPLLFNWPWQADRAYPTHDA
ncbi:MAG: hypothetical protein FWF84_01160, partial [Kiritimatiellaeota bacterium]|nr:hypothetical protein [Kiritimatiellota bacterium]